MFRLLALEIIKMPYFSFFIRNIIMNHLIFIWFFLNKLLKCPFKWIGNGNMIIIKILLIILCHKMIRLISLSVILSKIINIRQFRLYLFLFKFIYNYLIRIFGYYLLVWQFRSFMDLVFR